MYYSKHREFSNWSFLNKWRQNCHYVLRNITILVCSWSISSVSSSSISMLPYWSCLHTALRTMCTPRSSGGQPSCIRNCVGDFFSFTRSVLYRIWCMFRSGGFDRSQSVLFVTRRVWFARITTAAPECKLSVNVIVQQLRWGVVKQCWFDSCKMKIRINWISISSCESHLLFFTESSKSTFPASR